LRTKRGSDIHVKINITKSIDADGTITGWLITAKDMTRIRNNTKELVNRCQKLQHTIKALQQKAHEMVHSEKLAFGGRIAASVAHEIRNPLNIISMAIQQLHSELKQHHSHREYTTITLGHIERMNKLLTEFVDVTRPLKLKMRLEDINTILENVIASLRPKFEERNAEVIIKLDVNLPRIKIDKAHIIQAFSNLLLNSCEACPKRGGKIWLTSKRRGNYITIAIRNTGMPIPKKDLIRIGEPFFTSKKGGTGLGMSIAYSIIGSHDGIISVESNRKIGTVFNVRLPIPREAEQISYEE
jgi:signal transduction histidine kinase